MACTSGNIVGWCFSTGIFAYLSGPVNFAIDHLLSGLMRFLTDTQMTYVASPICTAFNVLIMVPDRNWLCWQNRPEKVFKFQM